MWFNGTKLEQKFFTKSANERDFQVARIQERKRKDGRSSFTATIRIKGHPIETATFARKTDAVQWAKETEVAIKNGKYFKVSESRKHTLAELIDRYIENVLPFKGIDEKERQRNETYLNWWKNKIGVYFLSDITPVLLAEYRDKLLKEPYTKFKRAKKKTEDKKREEAKKQEEEKKEREYLRSNATVNRYMAALSTALTTATNEWGWLEENPMFKVKKKVEPRGRVRYLTVKEKERLLEACQNCSNKNLYIVVVLALTTGARLSEIMHLKWENVDLKRKMIYFLDTKNDDRRSVPLSKKALELLNEHSKVRKINTKYVFSGKKDNKPVELKRRWEKAVEDAGLKDFRFHDLRHTAASYLAMNGATLMDLSHILGHKTLQMVKRYSHLTDQHTAKLIEKTSNKHFDTKKTKKTN